MRFSDGNCECLAPNVRLARGIRALDHPQFPARFFGQVVEAGFHEAALQMVAEGKIDGAAIDCHVLSQKPRIAEQLRVIETLGPAPSQPVVVRAGLEAEVKTRIRETLLRLHDPLMNELGVERFVPAPDYSAIADFVGTIPATNGWR